MYECIQNNRKENKPMICIDKQVMEGIEFSRRLCMLHNTLIGKPVVKRAGRNSDSRIRTKMAAGQGFGPHNLLVHIKKDVS